MKGFSICRFGMALTLGFSFGASAFAGGMEGGGGNAVVCRDSTQKITSAQLLDLYEAQALYGLNIPRSNLPYKDQYRAMYARVNQAILVPVGDPIEDSYGPGFPDSPLVPTLLGSGVAITGPVDDIGTTVVPMGCAIEALAYYDDVFQKLYVNSEIWESLGETDRAALLVHEGLYRYLRTYGETSSDRTRQQVGWIASDMKLTGIYQGMPQDPQLQYCRARSLSGYVKMGFYLYREKNIKSDTSYIYHIYFWKFDALPVVSQESTSFNAPDFSSPTFATGSYSSGLFPVSSGVGPIDGFSFYTTPDPNGKVVLHMKVLDGFFPHDEFDTNVDCQSMFNH